MLLCSVLSPPRTRCSCCHRDPWCPVYSAIFLTLHFTAFSSNIFTFLTFLKCWPSRGHNLHALIARRYFRGLPALGIDFYQGLTALGTVLLIMTSVKHNFTGAATDMGCSRWSGGFVCKIGMHQSKGKCTQDRYKAVLRPGSPWYRNVPNDASPGYKAAPRGCEPWSTVLSWTWRHVDLGVYWPQCTCCHADKSRGWIYTQKSSSLSLLNFIETMKQNFSLDVL